MRRKVAIALVAVLVALTFFTSPAFALAIPTTGDVIRADRSAQTLTINVQGHGMTFSVAEEAEQMLGRLNPGDRVTVSYSYTDADGKLTAQSITKLPVGGSLGKSRLFLFVREAKRCLIRKPSLTC